MFNSGLFNPNIFTNGLFGQAAESVTIDFSGGITEIEFRYSTGDLLSDTPSLRAKTSVDRPEYVAVPRHFAGGILPLRPIGVGTSTLTVTYVDPNNGLTSITRTIQVLPQ